MLNVKYTNLKRNIYYFSLIYCVDFFFTKNISEIIICNSSSKGVLAYIICFYKAVTFLFIDLSDSFKLAK